MSKNREKRAEIANETINILKKGFYQNPQEEIIDIRESLQAAIENSIHYSENDISQVFSQLEKKQLRETQNKIQIEVNNETTLYAARRLVNQQGYKKVLCLNFASAKNIPNSQFPYSSLIN